MAVDPQVAHEGLAAALAPRRGARRPRARLHRARRRHRRRRVSAADAAELEAARARGARLGQLRRRAGRPHVHERRAARAPRARDAVGRRRAGARRVDEDPQRRRERRAVRSLRPVSRPAVDARHRAAARPRAPRSHRGRLRQARRSRDAPTCSSSSRSTSSPRRKFWRRGDHAVLATLGIRPAGIAWTARGPVEVPELQPHAADDEVRRLHPLACSSRPRRAAVASRPRCSSTSRRSCARPTRIGRGR